VSDREEDLTFLPARAETVTSPATTLNPAPRATSSIRPPESESGPLSVGEAFGTRYHIIRLLGMGGMGAVYHAWDQELGVAVALKVIRPEVVAEDPAAALDMERRFKRELLLARQVTHPNFVRIHDLGEFSGIKYISMPYVEGEDLATRLQREGKLPVSAALKVARQVAAGLAAAHAAGIIHRDLKPANIMIGKDEQALIMDFGIARSAVPPAAMPPAVPASRVPASSVPARDLTTSLAALAGGQTLDVTVAPAAGAEGATMMGEASGISDATMMGDAATIAPPPRVRTSAPPAGVVGASLVQGAIVGTIAYMAPEQARAAGVDHRADIYAFGMIFSDMLLGRRTVPDGMSPVEALQQRIQQPAVSLRASDASLPEAVDALVLRCLQLDPAARFQTTDELVATLERLDENGEPIPEPRRFTPRMIAASVMLLAVLMTGTWWLTHTPPPPKAHDPVSVVIADLVNSTGDPAFNSTLEQTFRRGLEDASFISAYDRSRVSALGVRAPEKLDEAAARGLALKQGLGVVLSGSIDRRGGGYEISVKAAEAVTGNEITSVKRRASNRDDVLKVVTRLMADVRQELGDKTPESAQLFAMRSMSTSSLEVVGHYAAAVQAQARGQYEDARASLLEAVKLDPKFGLGYSTLAIMSRNLDRQDDANKYVKDALSYLEGMTDREKFATRGFYYTLTGDNQQCAKEFGESLVRYPADNSARNQRAGCLVGLRRYREATEEMRQAVKILPKHVTYRTNLALLENLTGDFQLAEDDVRAIEQPTARTLLVLAYSQLGRGLLPEAAQTYQKLATVGAVGASSAALGLGDLAVYEGRFSDAVRIFEQGAAEDLKAKTTLNAAIKLTSMAYAHLMAGQKGPAVAAADKALVTSKAIPVRFLAARIFVEAGAINKARPLAAALSAELPAEPQANGKIIEGQIALKAGKPGEAIKILTEANGLLDTWLAHFELGRAYLEAGALPQADSEFDRCIARRGEALSLVGEGPSYGNFPLVYYYQGRVREDMKTVSFADSYREYLKTRAASTDDPLLPDVRRRAGK
jgi:serine/threonine protein kinase/tetratricopeptide (TPR) repeat protein